MKKNLLSLLAALLVVSSLAAQEEASTKEPSLVFFSDEVPRYTDLAVGVFGTNQYGLGGWGDFAPAMLGGGISLECTLPEFLPKNLDLGFSIHVDYAHIFPNKDSTLKRGDDICAIFAVWLRIPFLLFGQRFAFQPEFGYGVIFHNAEGQNGSKGTGWYKDSVISVAPAFRWIVPKLDTIEIEAAPLYTFATEKENRSLNQLGFRLGIIWHVDSFISEM